MGKFAKGCLIIAGVFMGIGLIIGIIVSVIGGKSFFSLVNNQSMMWGNNIAIRSVSGGWDWNFWRFEDNDLTVNDNPIGERNFEREISSEGIDNLDIVAGACSFVLEEWEEDDFLIKISGSGQCDYYAKGGCLYIEGFKKSGRYVTDNEISLYVPRDMAYDHFRFHLGAGKSKVYGIKADTITCNVGMGQASFTGTEVKNINIKTGMGETVFEGRIREDASISCGMGNVAMLLDGRKEDYDYSLKCTFGNISLDDESFYTLAGNKNIRNGSEGNIRLECGMGSIDIRFRD